jgi:hypothetical protein
VARGDRQVAAEVRVARRPPADHQEVDELDEQQRLAARRRAHRVDQRAQPRHEAIVADAQERPRRHVADAGGLDHQHAGAARGEPRVPVDHRRGDLTVVAGAPRHHRRHPGAGARGARPQRDRLEPARARGRGRRRRLTRSAARASGARAAVRLRDLLGTRAVVLYFYPKDETPGCTAQACEFRDRYQDFVDAGADVIGVSRDDAGAHASFKQHHGCRSRSSPIPTAPPPRPSA